MTLKLVTVGMFAVSLIAAAKANEKTSKTELLISAGLSFVAFGVLISKDDPEAKKLMGKVLSKL